MERPEKPEQGTYVPVPIAGQLYLELRPDGEWVLVLEASDEEVDERG